MAGLLTDSPLLHRPLVQHTVEPRKVKQQLQHTHMLWQNAVEVMCRTRPKIRTRRQVAPMRVDWIHCIDERLSLRIITVRRFVVFTQMEGVVQSSCVSRLHRVRESCCANADRLCEGGPHPLTADRTHQQGGGGGRGAEGVVNALPW